jgi:tetratricopeptide (TPR) repeat protein
MGEVFAAIDTQLERKVALKAIRAEHRLKDASKARFLREARALSKLEHPGICRIYDYIEAEDQDYLVLELIEGEPLSELLKNGPLERVKALRIAEQLADALNTAHAEGMLHRDLKPANVMLTYDGEAKILDFGLARSIDEQIRPTQSEASSITLQANDGGETQTSGDMNTMTSADSLTRVGTAIGTPLYMSPEQARGDLLTPASDLFSFGLLLHEMLTGKRAYQGVLNDGLAGQIAAGDAPKVEGLDRALTDLIQRLKSPAASRRPTADDTFQRLTWIRATPQRRLRRLGIAAIIFVAIGASVKYAVDLARERATAEFRRAQSDAHIEFMVEELYNKLQPVGRLDILEEVGNKALDYFGTLNADERTDEDRARLGRTLTKIGLVQLNLGELDSAQAYFERSHAIHAALVKQDPTVSEWQIGFGAAQFGLGNIAWFNNDLDRVERRFEAYLSIAEDLMRLDAKASAHQLEMGYALTNLAALYEAQERYDRAIKLLKRAAGIKQALSDSDPENTKYLTSLANTIDWLGRTADEMGDKAGQIQYLHQGVELRRQLAESSHDADARHQLSVALHDLASEQQVRGQLEESNQNSTESLSISQSLVMLDSTNAEWRVSLNQTLTHRGDTLMALGRLTEARISYTMSYQDLFKLVSTDNIQPYWITCFDMARFGLASLELAEGKYSAAREILMSSPIQESEEMRGELDTLRQRLEFEGK